MTETLGSLMDAAFLVRKNMSLKYFHLAWLCMCTCRPVSHRPGSLPHCATVLDTAELSQDLNGNSQAAATRQKMSQLEQMLTALDQLRRVGLTLAVEPAVCS